jgi:two-component system sensor histidine kinase FlrB
MSELNALSQSFVNSYENLEGQVEQLNDELHDVNEQRSEAIQAKKDLINENQTITDRLQNLLAILPSGVVVIDGEGKVRECNAVAINILGRPLLGEAWLSVINRAFLPQADDGHQISLKDGRKVHLETRALDSEPGQMIVLTDMTKTRKLQEKLSQQQKLSSMGNMIASLAHQIRTPLSAAILYGSHLNGSQLTADKKIEFSSNLLERLKFMDRQISDMLNFVKGERKEKKLIDVNELVMSVKSSCAAFTHTINFEIDEKSIENKLFFSDCDSLTGAITNLIDNAIDATKNDIAVKVKIGLDKHKKLAIQVIDQGKGISLEQQNKIFEPFHSTKNNGNGLGLAIVHGIIIEHKGAIKINSIEAPHENQGSNFSICLPLYLSESKDEKIKKELVEVTHG